MTVLASFLAAVAVMAGLHRLVEPSGLRSGARRPSAGGLVSQPVGGSGAALASSHPAWFGRMAYAADLAPVGRWWQAAAGLVGMVAFGALVVGGPVFAVVAAAGASAAILGALRSVGHRRDGRVARSVPEALDAVARACRAGASVPQALRELGTHDAGPAGEALAEVALQVDRGVAMRDALDDLVGRHPVPALRLAAAALLVGADTGAAPARAVEGVATTLRDRAALDREAAAQATQAKASAAVLVLAPVGFGLFAVVADPRVATFLFRTVPGWLCLVLGAALDLLGAWWMSRIVRSAR